MRFLIVTARSRLMGSLASLAVAIGCGGASAEVAAPVDPLPSHAGVPDAPTEPTLVRLTGGVGNHVVDSFDQLRAAVRPLGSAIDGCYRSTANDGGWRENLMWDLDVSDHGRVTHVALHDAEYWRGDHVVAATPAPALAQCMDHVLRRLVVPAPVRAGSIRLRFEL